MNTNKFRKLIETSELSNDTEFIDELYRILDTINTDFTHMILLGLLFDTAESGTNYKNNLQFAMINRAIFITMDYGVKHKFNLNDYKMMPEQRSRSYTTWSTYTLFSPEIYKYVHSWLSDFKHFAIQDDEFKTDDSSDIIY